MLITTPHVFLSTLMLRFGEVRKSVGCCCHVYYITEVILPTRPLTCPRGGQHSDWSAQVRNCQNAATADLPVSLALASAPKAFASDYIPQHALGRVPDVKACP